MGGLFPTEAPNRPLKRPIVAFGNKGAKAIRRGHTTMVLPLIVNRNPQRALHPIWLTLNLKGIPVQWSIDHPWSRKQITINNPKTLIGQTTQTFDVGWSRAKRIRRIPKYHDFPTAGISEVIQRLVGQDAIPLTRLRRPALRFCCAGESRPQQSIRGGVQNCIRDWRRGPDPKPNGKLTTGLRTSHQSMLTSQRRRHGPRGNHKALSHK